MLGAWHLHEQTRDLPLDFFVLYSSNRIHPRLNRRRELQRSQCVPGRVAHARQCQGLPALAVNWGPWIDTGLASDPRLAANWTLATNAAVKPLSPGNYLEVLERAIHQGDTQLAVLAMDWADWRSGAVAVLLQHCYAICSPRPCLPGRKWRLIPLAEPAAELRLNIDSPGLSVRSRKRCSA